VSKAKTIWAVVPVKTTADAKQRLARLLSPTLRQQLALVMIEDVLSALAAVPTLAGIAVVTIDQVASRLAQRFGARVIGSDATSGHTAAVTGAARLLAGEGKLGIMTVPGDVPLITADEVTRLLAAHGDGPAFTIAPAHDERGSNAVLLSPPTVVPLRFGDDSFLPHLAAARAQGLEPTILKLPGVALDIDQPEDVAAFMRVPSHTRTREFLAEAGVLGERDEATIGDNPHA
jgi:2-phospho-L-lactate guanylyltransferase